jgi:hypothetical protein
MSNDLVAARAFYEESLAHFRHLGDTLGTALLLSALGVVDARQGDLVTTQSLFEQSLPLMRTTGDLRDLAMLLAKAGWMQLLRGDPKQAGNLLREGLRLWRDAQTLFPPTNTFLDDARRADIDHSLAEARAHLDAVAFAAGWAVGLHLRCILEIKMANAIDAALINDSSIGGLEYPLKGEQTNKEEQGKQDEAKDEKGCSQVGDLPDKCEGNQCTGHSPDKEGVATIDVCDFLSLSRLQSVMFRCHHGDDLRGKL